MLLTLSELTPEPLHSQISRQIRAKILAGSLPTETGLPSIRTLAKDQRVSVITVKRAYEDLEREGLIHARKGKGFFVRPLTGKQKESLAQQRLNEALSPLLSDAIAQGLEPAQIKETVNSIIKGKGSRS